MQNSMGFYTGLILLNFKMVYALLKEVQNPGTWWGTLKDFFLFFLCFVLVVFILLGEPLLKIWKLFEQRVKVLMNMLSN